MGKESNVAGVLTSASNALRLLSVMSSTPTVRVVDVSRQLGIAPSTAHRLLNCLKAEGFVRQQADSRRYTVGQEMLRLARHFSAQNSLERAAHVHLEALSRAVNETVNLQVLVKDEVLCIDAVVETGHELHVKHITGRRTAAHACAAGKVLLAALTSADRDGIYGTIPLAFVTNHTIVDRDRLEEELVTVRSRGYALNEGERVAGVHAVAVPVLNLDDCPIAAISIAAPAVRMPKARIPGLVRDLRRARAAITADFFAVEVA